MEGEKSLFGRRIARTTALSLFAVYLLLMPACVLGPAKTEGQPLFARVLLFAAGALFLALFVQLALRGCERNTGDRPIAIVCAAAAGCLAFAGILASINRLGKGIGEADVGVGATAGLLECAALAAVGLGPLLFASRKTSAARMLWIGAGAGLVLHIYSTMYVGIDMWTALSTLCFYGGNILLSYSFGPPAPADRPKEIAAAGAALACVWAVCLFASNVSDTTIFREMNFGYMFREGNRFRGLFHYANILTAILAAVFAVLVAVRLCGAAIPRRPLIRGGRFLLALFGLNAAVFFIYRFIADGTDLTRCVLCALEGLALAAAAFSIGRKFRLSVVFLVVGAAAHALDLVVASMTDKLWESLGVLFRAVTTTQVQSYVLYAAAFLFAAAAKNGEPNNAGQRGVGFNI